MKLPKGFSVAGRDPTGLIVVLTYKEPSQTVTLDYKIRGFTLGSNVHCPRMGYTGDNWRDQLLADATSELASVYDTPPRKKK